MEKEIQYKIGDVVKFRKPYDREVTKYEVIWPFKAGKNNKEDLLINLEHLKEIK